MNLLFMIIKWKKESGEENFHRSAVAMSVGNNKKKAESANEWMPVRVTGRPLVPHKSSSGRNGDNGRTDSDCESLHSEDHVNHGDCAAADCAANSAAAADCSRDAGQILPVPF